MTIPIEKVPRKVFLLDEDVQSLFDKLEIIEVTQQVHSKRLLRLQRNMTGLRAQVIGLKSDVTGLKSDVTGLKTDVTGLKADVTRMDGKLDLILARLPER